LGKDFRLNGWAGRRARASRRQETSGVDSFTRRVTEKQRHVHIGYRAYRSTPRPTAVQGHVAMRIV